MFIAMRYASIRHFNLLAYPEFVLWQHRTKMAPQMRSLFFVRLYRNPAVNLSVVKEFLCKMTEKEQAYVVPSRKAVFVRCCLKAFVKTIRRAEKVFPPA